MRTLVHERFAGDTIRLTWINSGVTPTIISSALRDGSDTVISSMAAISSGNGHYYSLHSLPNTPGSLVNEWIAVINANTYVHKQRLRAFAGDVD